MVKKFISGDEFIKENADVLNNNKYMSALFYMDAQFVDEGSNTHFTLRISNGNKNLIAMKVAHYELMLLGDKECVEEFLLYAKENKYEYDEVLCTTEIGDKLIESSNKIIGKSYVLCIGMDFMEANEYIEESSKNITFTDINDIDELYDCSAAFVKECGLNDKTSKDRIRDRINSYRVIRKDNKIVSIVRVGPDTDSSLRISMVYTRPEYRVKGYAREVVNYAKNEILNLGKVATLNVDQKNPVSNHIYKSLGFKKVFSQGIYRTK